MTNKECVIDELCGAIAGLFLSYGISSKKGAGKIITDLLKRVEKQLQRKIAEFEQYKKSKQASYEALQTRCNELELSNRKLKQECQNLHTELRFKVNYIQEQRELINHSYKELEPFQDEYFKGLDTKQIAELAKKSIRLTTENRKLEDALDEIEGCLKNELKDDK